MPGLELNSKTSSCEERPRSRRCRAKPKVASGTPGCLNGLSLVFRV